MHIAALPYRKPLLTALLLAAALLAQACSSPESPIPTPTLTPTVAPPEGATALEERAMAYLRHLAEELGPRDTASGGELGAALYLQEQFRQLGYQTRLQEFTITGGSAESTVTVLSPQEQPVAARPLRGSAVGRVSGPLVDVGLAGSEDLPDSVSLRGQVALIARGSITFREKVERAAVRGAVAALIYNNEPGAFDGTLGSAGPIPAVGISREEGLALLEAMALGQVAVLVQVTTTELTSQNVVAEKPGTTERVVLLGGHYDSVPETQGARDNASGTAVLLAVAQEVAARDFPFTLRFVAFGGEELGLWGSRHYVDSLSPEERGRIDAMLNFDLVAGDAPLGVTGDGALARSLQALDETLSAAALPSRVSSDHAPFLNAGIPAVIVSTPDFDLIHTPQDTVEQVRPESLGQAVALALDYLEELARRAGQ